MRHAIQNTVRSNKDKVIYLGKKLLKRLSICKEVVEGKSAENSDNDNDSDNSASKEKCLTMFQAFETLSTSAPSLAGKFIPFDTYDDYKQFDFLLGKLEDLFQREQVSK